MWCIFSAAFAAGPPNGDFGSGLDDWAIDGLLGDAEVALVTEGDNFSETGDSTNLNFPSAPDAVMLKGGTAGSVTAAGIESGPFTITHVDLDFQHRSESAEVTNTVRILAGPVNLQSEVFEPHINGSSFRSHTLDVEALCGQRASLQLVQWNAVSASRFYTVVDDAELGGSLCPDYDDQDGDGFCVHGLDLTMDGDCDDPGEAEPSTNPVVDCDDGAASVFPGAVEVEGDGIDQDCDGGDLTGDCYIDADQDGFGGMEVLSTFCDGIGETRIGGDCDDSSLAIFPGAVEIVIDGIDQDCDGGDLCFIDMDADGFGQIPGPGSLGCDQPGETTVAGDCDDGRASAYPGAPEQCNALDDDCDGVTDPGNPSTAYVDVDGDGFGAGPSLEVCGDTLGVADNDLDCDDTEPATNPAAVELPGDGVDTDCDSTELCYTDADGDGFAGEALIDGPIDCSGLFNEVTDCDDTLAFIFPGAAETPADGIDQDCDGGDHCFVDTDADGFGTQVLVQSTDLACDGLGEAPNGTDCDDTAPQIHPGATEILDNELDEDCDGLAQQSPPPPEDSGLDPATAIYRGSGACSSVPLAGLWWLPLLVLMRRSR